VRYTGTLIRDLQSLAEVCLLWNDRICVNCGQCPGVHSDPDGLCLGAESPGGDHLQTSFREPDKQVVASSAASNSESFCHSGDGKNE